LAVVVAMVMEVDVAVTGGVPFGHPLPPKMSTIILTTLSNKVIVLNFFFKSFHATVPS
jgi:hypothetical protein